MMKKINDILFTLDKYLFDARCELTRDDIDFHFLLKVMLSAQTTDRKVNEVSNILFQRYSTLDDFIGADINELTNFLSPLGLAKIKSKRIKDICYLLKESYSSSIPASFSVLTTLPGVGRKTANVVLAELFHVPSIPVDTHVNRVSKRLGLVGECLSVEEVEIKLEKMIDKDRQIRFHHQLIHVGRQICLAKKPRCNICFLRSFCKTYLGK